MRGVKAATVFDASDAARSALNDLKAELLSHNLESDSVVRIERALRDIDETAVLALRPPGIIQPAARTAAAPNHLRGHWLQV
jgi:hypothetical protein